MGAQTPAHKWTLNFSHQTHLTLTPIATNPYQLKYMTQKHKPHTHTHSLDTNTSHLTHNSYTFSLTQIHIATDTCMCAHLCVHTTHKYIPHKHLHRFAHTHTNTSYQLTQSHIESYPTYAHPNSHAQCQVLYNTSKTHLITN